MEDERNWVLADERCRRIDSIGQCRVRTGTAEFAASAIRLAG